MEGPNTGGAVGWCLEAHDLAVSKLIAGRAKDLEFVAGLATFQSPQRDAPEAGSIGAVRCPHAELTFAQRDGMGEDTVVSRRRP
jgi:hypothetical protein